MSSDLNSASLASLCKAIVDNRGRTCPTAASGMPLIATNCISNDGLYPTYNTVRFVDDETYRSWFRGHPKPGDLILVLKGSPGRVALAPDPVDFCIAQDMVAITVDDSRVYPRYLLALLRSPAVQRRIEQMHVGTLIPHFKKGDFDKLHLPIPGWDVQRQIGDSYFALSARIELGRRTNRTLESIARATFKSWFVDFDPVHKKVLGGEVGLSPDLAALYPDRLEESAIGQVPAGWDVRSLGSLAILESDRIDADAARDQLRYIALDDMPSKSIDLSSWRSGAEVTSSIIAFRAGDILFGSMRPYFHKVGLAPFAGITRTTTFVLRPTDDSLRHFALMHFSSDEVIDHATTCSVGTTIPYVRWEALASYRVAVPPPDLLKAYQRLSSPLCERMRVNGQMSVSLREACDALLPRLTSGQALAAVS